jgi:hypothetical protein
MISPLLVSMIFIDSNRNSGHAVVVFTSIILALLLLPFGMWEWPRDPPLFQFRNEIGNIIWTKDKGNNIHIYKRKLTISMVPHIGHTQGFWRGAIVPK